jgi:hypothetical protein
MLGLDEGFFFDDNFQEVKVKAFSTTLIFEKVLNNGHAMLYLRPS